MRYNSAVWMPIPETNTQKKIKPRLFIVHSIIAPWEPTRTKEYWNQSGVNLESHFGIGYSGSIGQFVDTSVRADANMHANDFAISVETASDTKGSDPWNQDQIEALISLGVEAVQRDGIPLRMARDWNGDGFGYHRMFPQWSNGGTACPGTRRVQQFHEVVFPGIQKRANGGFPGRQYFFIGAYNGHVTTLDNRLIAKGYNKFHDGDGYQAGPRFTEYTRRNVQMFQKDQNWSGSDADGFPGPETWRRLFS